MRRRGPAVTTTPPGGLRHATGRSGALRALVLGANDGVISTACLILGVAAADADRAAIVTAGAAGLVAGAASMALGEYVSVSSQRDAEDADIAKERWELAHRPERELAELTTIYVAKGLEPGLARQVAAELMQRDALRAHLTDELGMTEASRARPLQAAGTSGAAFSIGAAVPLATAALASATWRAPMTVALVVVTLVVLGTTGALIGGARPVRPVLRTVVGGLAAMALTTAIGRLLGATVT